MSSWHPLSLYSHRGAWPRDFGHSGMSPVRDIPMSSAWFGQRYKAFELSQGQSPLAMKPRKQLGGSVPHKEFLECPDIPLICLVGLWAI